MNNTKFKYNKWRERTKKRVVRMHKIRKKERKLKLTLTVIA